MAIRTNFVAGEDYNASEHNEENTQILANQADIAAIIYNKKVYSTHTLVNIANTTAETTLITTTLPGGSLGTGNSVYGRLWISRLRANTTNSVTLRLKYGATTVISQAITLANAEFGAGLLEFELRASGATNTQDADLLFHTATNATINASTVTSARLYLSGTGAEDSTANKTLAVTAQWNAASTNNIIEMNTATVTLIRS